MTPLTTRLYGAWKAAVLAGNIVNEFEAAQADAGDRWKKGDRIRYGIQYIEYPTPGSPATNSPVTNGHSPQSPFTESFAYYAHNLTQNRPIQGATAEKRIPKITPDPSASRAHPGYLCRLNGYRALRPGASDRPIGRQPGLSPAPERCRFHCQNPSHPLSVASRAPLLTISLTHFTWNAYYNAAPLEKNGHVLWIPTVPTSSQPTNPQPTARSLSKTERSASPQAISQLPHHPQALTPTFLTDAIHLYEQLSHTILFFNSLHSGASVNHIHFQAIAHTHLLPIETATLEAHGGYPVTGQYPISAFAFTRPFPRPQVTHCLEQLSRNGIPYNLVMLGDRLMIFPRNIDHEVVSEFPGDALAALELCGAIHLVNTTDYDTLEASRVETAYSKVTLPATDLIAAWNTPT